MTSGALDVMVLSTYDLSIIFRSSVFEGNRNCTPLHVMHRTMTYCLLERPSNKEMKVLDQDEVKDTGYWFNKTDSYPAMRDTEVH